MSGLEGITVDGIRVAKLVGKLTYESFAVDPFYREEKCKMIDSLRDDHPNTVREIYGVLDSNNQRTFRTVVFALPNRGGLAELRAWIDGMEVAL